MLFLCLKTALYLLGSILWLYPGEGIRSEGYRTIVSLDDGFLAAGSGGRIDWISVTGKVIKSENFPGENFNSLLCDNQRIIVAGDRGIILISSDDGLFRKVDSGTDKNINSLSVFKGMIIAGNDDGEILSGNEKEGFRKIRPGLKGNVVSVSARLTDCYGVTDEGEIIHTVDGINWDIFDFNQVYSGFYKPCYFTRILVTENRIAVAGIQNDGWPVFMFSNQGNVWTERKLNFNDEQGMTDVLTDRPNDIFYDQLHNQFILVCDKGKLMKLPSCSHCNKLVVLSKENFTGISGIEDILVIVGENYDIKVAEP